MTNGVDHSILMLAPGPGDAGHAERILESAGFRAQRCADVNELALAAGNECGCVFLTEECLSERTVQGLGKLIAEQPAWSDLPFVVALRQNTRLQPASRKMIGALGNVLLIERPLSADAFVAAIGAALRGRHWQFALRAAMREREELLNSLERRVAERTAKLNASNQELEAFSYTVAHDLRAPLRTIAGFASVLVDDYSTVIPPEAAQYLERISKATKRLDVLTSDLLAYARLTAEDVPLADVDLGTLVAYVLNDYPSLQPHRDHIQVMPSLGNVVANESSLAQCVSNLLENAVRFSKPGAPPEIRVYCEKRGAQARLCVTDRGIGIAPQHHEKIFRIFETLSPANGSQTGIGLAIVRKAVERMGGKTGVESVPGQGATFWIELPRANGCAATVAMQSAGRRFER